MFQKKLSQASKKQKSNFVHFFSSTQENFFLGNVK